MYLEPRILFLPCLDGTWMLLVWLLLLGHFPLSRNLELKPLLLSLSRIIR